MKTLINERKALQKRINKDPALKEALDPQIAEIDKILESRVNQHDQNFLRTFYRTAKEGLPNEVFNRLEDVSSTRQHNHVSQN